MGRQTGALFTEGEMPVLQQTDRAAVQRRFQTELKRDVTLKLYTQFDIGLFIPGRECRTCGPTRELVEEVSALSPRIHLEVVDYYKNREEAASRGIDRVPAVTIGSGDSPRIRFFGMPSGFEFAQFLDSVIASSEKKSSLPLETRRQLKDLEDDVHIKVFVTPTGQYCSPVASLAHTMAIESPRVTADVIQVQEFPDLASVHNVMGVPKTVINDTVVFTGAVSEETFLHRVMEAVGAVEPDDSEVEPVSGQTTPVA